MLDLNTEFRDYRNQYEILQGVQLNKTHIAQIANVSESKKITIKIDGVKIIYLFDTIKGYRYFKELRILGRLNQVKFVAYENDYIVRDKTGIYILSKGKFDTQYSLIKYEQEEICL